MVKLGFFFILTFSAGYFFKEQLKVGVFKIIQDRLGSFFISTLPIGALTKAVTNTTCLKDLSPLNINGIQQ